MKGLDKLFKTVLWKEQWTAPFVAHPADSHLSRKSQENAMVKQIALSGNEICR